MNLGRSARTRRLAMAVALACLALAACATYHARPLPTAVDLRSGADQLKVDVAQLRLGPLKGVTIDPNAGLTPLDVAVMAALASPDLRARRAALGVSAAQVFAAGLLPDPQIAAGFDKPIGGPDTHTAYTISPSLDLAGLLAVVNNERAARFTARQADLDLLWAEWTTAQQARQLAETALTDEARASFLRDLLAAVADRAERTGRAMAAGDVAAPTAAADLAAKLDVESQLAAAEQGAAKARRDLNALLGLQAQVALPLIAGPEPRSYDNGQVERDLASLPTRRPDLIALQAGYAAQDATLRKAIIAQFPLVSIAIAYARDPANTTTIGLSAVSALPIFNGSRGEVKVQEATREQLRAEYQARLDASAAEVRNAAAELAGAQAQARVLRADLPRLETMLRPAPGALARGDIDSQTYLTLVQTVIGKRAELEDRELAARIAEIQLETALFAPPAELAGAS